MEILIDDIPEEGLEIAATEADPWLCEIVRDACGEAFEPGDCASLKVSFHKVDGNVNLDGRLELTSHPDCDRCLAHYAESFSVPIHGVLAPLLEMDKKGSPEGEAEAELVMEDLEFGFYEGDRFDLAEIVREQTLLARPMKHLCRADCRGLCQRCGKNLNEGPCSCAESKGDPRWAPLENVRIPEKKVKGQR